MLVRRLPGAVTLGLLASTLGHAAAYGNSHAIGGAYHGILLALVITGVGGALLTAFALAWIGARRVSDGSVLAARLAPYLPGPGAVTAAAVTWFSIAESVEGAHASAGTLTILMALFFASLLVHALAFLTVRAIATLVITIRSMPFARRAHATVRYLDRPLPIRAAAHARRMFARPPPSSMRFA